jgi:hypothetical protein
MPVQKESVEMPDMLRSFLLNRRTNLTAFQAGGLPVFCPGWVSLYPDTSGDYVAQPISKDSGEYRLVRRSEVR